MTRPVRARYEGTTAGKLALAQQIQGNVLRVALPARPRKLPRQARSVAMVEALKKTGREILEQHGREALTVYRLSACSGVAISSIYEYFPTIEALITAIFEEYRAREQVQVLASLAALPAAATLYDGIEVIVQASLAALHQWLQVDPQMALRTALQRELVRLEVVCIERAWTSTVIPALLERFAEEVQVSDHEKAAYLAYQVLTALPRALVLDRPGYLQSADTVRSLSRMVHTLLTTAGPE